MEVYEIKEYTQLLSEFLNNKIGSMLVTSAKNYVLKGLDDEFDEELAQEYNLEVLNTKHSGGIIINFKGDICVGNFQNKLNYFGEEFLNALCEYLKSKELNCEIRENDLMINDFKTASFGSYFVGEKLYTAIHIPMNLDLDIINNVCKKEMEKVPKGLYDFGITYDEVYNFIENFIDKSE